MLQCCGRCAPSEAAGVADAMIEAEKVLLELGSQAATVSW